MQLSAVTAQAPWDDAMGKEMSYAGAGAAAGTQSECLHRPAGYHHSLSGIGEGKDGPSPQSAPFDATYWTAVPA